MALYILYPSGVTAKLPTCSTIYHLGDGRHEAYTASKDEGGSFIARIPADCIVSFQPFCQVQATATATDLTKRNALHIVNATIRTLGWSDRREVAALKRTLADYDARTSKWK